MICLAGDFRAAYIFGKGIEFIGQSRRLNFVVGVAIANHINVSIQVDVTDGFRLAIIFRKGVFPIEIDDFSAPIVNQVIGEYILLLNSVFGHDGDDEILEPIGNDKDIGSIIFQPIPVPLKGFGNLLLQDYDQLRYLGFGGLKNIESLFQTFSKSKASIHAFVSDILDGLQFFLLSGIT